MGWRSQEEAQRDIIFALFYNCINVLLLYEKAQHEAAEKGNLTDRDRQEDTERQRQADTERDRLTDRQTQTKMQRQTDTDIEQICTQRKRWAQRDTEGETQTDRQAQIRKDETKGNKRNKCEAADRKN